MILLPDSDGPYVTWARANWSRWIADCPLCTSALALTPGANPFTCKDCGAQARIIWPDQKMITGVERLLGMRPDPHTRNWAPGETLIDLMLENGQHGVFDDLPPALPGTERLIVDEGQICVDQLPMITTRMIFKSLEV